MSQPIRMAVLGAGSIGIRAALNHLVIGDYADRVTLAAVCDAVPGRAKAAAEKYNVPQHFEDYDELLKNGDIDAITVGTPIGLHYEQGVKAIEAGKHLHFNKTMTTTVEEADDLIARAAKANIKMVASPGQMIRPHNQKIREMIGNGDLGQLIWSAVGAGFGAYHEQESVRTGDDVFKQYQPQLVLAQAGRRAAL